MLQRTLRHQVQQRLKIYPAVAIVGPRQCGKTTLAQFLSGAYFDLEQATERLRLDLEWGRFISAKDLVILDEAQTWPDVFGPRKARWLARPGGRRPKPRKAPDAGGLRPVASLNKESFCPETGPRAWTRGRQARYNGSGPWGQPRECLVVGPEESRECPCSGTRSEMPVEPGEDPNMPNETMFPSQAPDRIRLLMAAFGLSLGDVVRASRGVSRTQLHGILSGNREASPGQRQAIAAGIVNCLSQRCDSAFLFFDK